MAHIGATGLQNLVGDIGIVWRAEERRNVQAEGGGADRQKLEITGMSGEEDMRLLLVAEAFENRNAFHFDQARRCGVGVEVENGVEEDIFREKARHRIPHFAGDFLDFRVAFLRISLTQIIGGNLVARRQRPDQTGHLG